MIPAKTMARLATIGLTDEQAEAVASMLAEVENATEEKVAAAIEAYEKERAELDRLRRAKARRRALNGLENDAQWLRLRRRVFERDGFRCVYCGDGAGKFSLHCDHVIPFSRGGASDMSNLATACHRCNSSKRDRTPEEWGAK